MNRILTCLFFLGALLGASLAAQELEIRFLDVGQADAVLVRQGGKTALIDAGGGAGVLAQLRRLGVDTIDLLVASHNHADHIGGMTAVLGGTVVRFYLDNGVPHTTATYQRTIQAVTASGAQYLRPTARAITLGNARLRVLPPPTFGDQNNSSVGILVQYGEFRALLTGDSEQLELQYWIEHDSIPRVTVVKVAHHGSRNGSTPDWIDTTHPQVAVISVGTGNTYGHPSAEVIQEWEGAGATVYRTDRDGTVIIQAKRDGSYIVLNERAGAAAAPSLTDPGRKPGVEEIRPRSCCRTCTTGKACGNSCINRANQCRQPRGCACDAKP